MIPLKESYFLNFSTNVCTFWPHNYEGTDSSPTTGLECIIRPF